MKEVGDSAPKRVVIGSHAVAQRIYALCCGWEDVTDHNPLRHDLTWQTAVGRDAPLRVKQHMIGQFDYASGTWERKRHVIARLEHDAHGAHPRFVVTSLQGDGEALYERLYCARGEALNRISRHERPLGTIGNVQPSPIRSPWCVAICGAHRL